MGYYDNIYNDENLAHRAKLVYLYLYDRTGSNGVAWPSIRRIAADTSLSVSTVKRALSDLIKAGYVKKESAYRENGGRTSNRYYVL
jgi:DNA-binding MarR family transcriptional regulator